MGRKSDNWSNCTNIAAAPELYVPSLPTSSILVLRHTIAAFVKEKGTCRATENKNTPVPPMPAVV